MKRLPLLLLLLLAACGKNPGSNYQGYVEGEWLYLSSPQGGYLESLGVMRGGRAEKGGSAFLLSGDQQAAENAALTAQLRAAESSLSNANAQLKRQRELEKDKFSSASRTDELRSAQAQAAAQVRVLREQLANKAVRFPASGEVTETYYRPGEWVPAGQPVLSLLPDDKRRIRFFVPETVIATLHSGQTIEANCDSCGDPIAATISFIAAQAEYTPPVIYSQGTREKLVFRIEAVPAAQDALSLRPGLPVEVSIK